MHCKDAPWSHKAPSSLDSGAQGNYDVVGGQSLSTAECAARRIAKMPRPFKLFQEVQASEAGPEKR